MKKLILLLLFIPLISLAQSSERRQIEELESDISKLESEIVRAQNMTFNQFVYDKDVAKIKSSFFSQGLGVYAVYRNGVKNGYREYEIHYTNYANESSGSVVNGYDTKYSQSDFEQYKLSFINDFKTSIENKLKSIDGLNSKISQINTANKKRKEFIDKQIEILNKEKDSILILINNKLNISEINEYEKLLEKINTEDISVSEGSKALYFNSSGNIVLDKNGDGIPDGSISSAWQPKYIPNFIYGIDTDLLINTRIGVGVKRPRGETEFELFDNNYYIKFNEILKFKEKLLDVEESYNTVRKLKLENKERSFEEGLKEQGTAYTFIDRLAQTYRREKAKVTKWGYDYSLKLQRREYPDRSRAKAPLEWELYFESYGKTIARSKVITDFVEEYNNVLNQYSSFISKDGQLTNKFYSTILELKKYINASKKASEIALWFTRFYLPETTNYYENNLEKIGTLSVLYTGNDGWWKKNRINSKIKKINKCLNPNELSNLNKIKELFNQGGGLTYDEGASLRSLIHFLMKNDFNFEIKGCESLNIQFQFSTDAENIELSGEGKETKTENNDKKSIDLSKYSGTYSMQGFSIKFSVINNNLNLDFNGSLFNLKFVKKDKFIIEADGIRNYFTFNLEEKTCKMEQNGQVFLLNKQ